MFRDITSSREETIGRGWGIEPTSRGWEGALRRGPSECSGSVLPTHLYPLILRTPSGAPRVWAGPVRFLSVWGRPPKIERSLCKRLTGGRFAILLFSGLTP